ncbi:MAG: cytochrome c3 family protein [Acidobacteriota bacterium]
MRRTLAPVLLAVAAATGSAPVLAGIADTKHNLSATSGNPVSAVSEERICIFCHAPHRSTTRTPLWNREDSRATYILYGSSTLDALPGQPTGTTRMCLSCHDGTVALGEVHSEPSEIEFPAGNRFLDPSTGGLTTDLADDHPVSFLYDDALAQQDPELVAPAAIPPPIGLDEQGEMQCTSCHDAHDDTYGKFLLVQPTGGALCTACHDKQGWSIGTHANSSAGWDGTPPDPWPGSADRTVADNACRSCHMPHTADQPLRLVRRSPEEQTCYGCHNGHVASLDLQAEFTKAYHHPVEQYQNDHDPNEDVLAAPRHVECVDCHEPHQARNQPASAPNASGALAGVRGIDETGQPVDPVQFQYEVCFSCHGDSTSANQAIPRSAGDINTRLEFASDAISFHPVVQTGRNNDVPSLLPPYTETSRIYCTDCHASDQADSGGSQGPHGSIYPHLLRRRYELDFQREDPAVYALCYECHSRSVLLNKDQSGFKEHKKHIEGEDSSCSICHDPHGIAAQNGDPTGNSHLISFDLRYVTPSNSGQLRFEDRGNRRGACWLTCHGKNHDPKSY